MSEKRCYTVKELQEILGVSRPTIYHLLKKNEFRWIQLDGGKYRISKKSLDDWLDKLPESSNYSPIRRKNRLSAPLRSVLNECHWHSAP